MPTPASDPSFPPDDEAVALMASSRRRTGAWIGLAVAAVLFVGGGILWGLTPTPVVYETAPVHQGDLVVTVTAVGQLEPVDAVEVGSDQSGTVVEVGVEANDVVQAGQVLARLDPGELDLSVQHAQAQLETARASLTQARVQQAASEAELARLTRLTGSGAVTEADLETAQYARDAAAAAVRVAAAQVRAASVALDQARQHLDDSVIRAPIAGLVTRRLVDPGQTVVSALQATPLFEVVSDLSRLEAIVAVDEADVGRVRAGQPATFTVSAWPDHVFAAVVERVDLAPQVAASVVTYDADLAVANAEGLLRPGMTATAEIEVDRLEQATLVPTAALRWEPEALEDAEEDDGEAVWVLEDAGPRRVPVTVRGTDGFDSAVEGEGLYVGLPVIVGVVEDG